MNKTLDLYLSQKQQYQLLFKAQITQVIYEQMLYIYIKKVILWSGKILAVQNFKIKFFRITGLIALKLGMQHVGR